jgi:hypothetical protein
MMKARRCGLSAIKEWSDKRFEKYQYAIMPRSALGKAIQGGKPRVLRNILRNR